MAILQICESQYYFLLSLFSIYCGCTTWKSVFPLVLLEFRNVATHFDLIFRFSRLLCESPVVRFKNSNNSNITSLSYKNIFIYCILFWKVYVNVISVNRYEKRNCVSFSNPTFLLFFYLQKSDWANGRRKKLNSYVKPTFWI